MRVVWCVEGETKRQRIRSKKGNGENLEINTLEGKLASNRIR
jgi:hypothetical protein